MESLEPLISVIVPAYNRLDALQMTLVHLNHQTLPKERFEVIVINDGSSLEIQNMIKTIDLTYSLTTLNQDHKGSAAARNLGVMYANGDILLFLDADMLAEPNLLEAHLKAHEIHPCALIEGLRKMHQSSQTPLFMQIIDVDTNPRKTPIDFPEILTSNLSIQKSSFLQIGGFNEWLMRWQDVEFGYRAQLAGFKLVFFPEAVAYHHHPLSFQQFCEKQKEHHRLAWLFFKFHPEAVQSFDYIRDKLSVDLSKDSLRIIIRKIIRMLLALPPVLLGMKQLITLFEKHFQSKKILRFLYWKVIGSYQLIGLREGYKIYLS